MFILRVITTVCIVLLFIIINRFEKDLTKENENTGIIGIGFMKLVYVLSLICMWWQAIKEVLVNAQD